MDDLTKIVLLCVLVVVILLGIGFLLDSASCEAKTIGMGFPHKFGILSGCLIQPENNEQWIPLNNWRTIE